MRTFEENDQTYSCVDASTEELYTGAATWESESEWSVMVTFADSSVRIIAEKDGYFLPSPDWGYISVRPCDTGGREWIYTLDCGDPGKSYVEVPREPCRD